MVSKPRERRFIMRGPEVVATLANLKTQCRRPIRGLDRVKHRIDHIGRDDCAEPACFMAEKISPQSFDCPAEVDDGTRINCPFGEPGDRLWVAETWCQKIVNGGFVYNADGDIDSSCCYYLASNPDVEGEGFTERGLGKSPWSSPATMPRRTCRLVLELVDIRAEHLQEITDEGATAEGANSVFFFASQWERMHGKEFAYSSNPWAWVPTYKVIEG